LRITVRVIGQNPVDLVLPTTGSVPSISTVYAAIQLTSGLSIIQWTYHGAAITFDHLTIGPAGESSRFPSSRRHLPPLSLKVAWKFDEVNGNGRVDFADVVWLFNHL
jgi:hypothetical protein